MPYKLFLGIFKENWIIVWLYSLGLSGNPQEKCEKCNKHNANAHFICYVIIVPVVQYLKNKPFYWSVIVRSVSIPSSHFTLLTLEDDAPENNNILPFLAVFYEKVN